LAREERILLSDDIRNPAHRVQHGYQANPEIDCEIKQINAVKRPGAGSVPGAIPRGRLICSDVWDVERGKSGVREPEGARRRPAEPDSGDALDWVRRKLGFEPDADQSRVMTSPTKRGLLNCTRQWGKSTITAARAVYEASHRKESLTLVVSPSGRQSGEFVRKAAGFARRLGIRPKGDGDNEMSLEFPNRSRIIGLPGSEATIRGFSAVGLLLVDEAARVSDELYLAIRPMLAVSSGTLWLMSTPFGQRGFFHETWARGGEEWERIRVPADECPRISRKFLEEERTAMGERWFRQEYLCEFVDAVSGVFERDLVQKAITTEVEPLLIP
jgi:hypothetical protein